MAGLRSSVGPDLLHALVDQLPDVTDAEVCLGVPVGVSSGDYLGVGVYDPAASRPAPGLTSSIEWGTAQFSDGFDEVGEVDLAAVAVRGSDDLAEVTDAVFGILADLIRHLRGSWSTRDLLGVEGLWDLRPSGLELVTAQDDNGCAAYLLIRLAFQARI